MLLIVSVTVLVVSVFEVIEPCVKLGTTGTAYADGMILKRSSSILYLFIVPQNQFIVNSLTNWPVATVPAPPAVTVITPALVIVPANVSFAPAAVDT